MADRTSSEPEPVDPSTAVVSVRRVSRSGAVENLDVVTIEQPLEISLEYGQEQHRLQHTVSVTMRTPGQDEELALGFLCTEGVISADIHPEDLAVHAPGTTDIAWGPDDTLRGGGTLRVSVAEGAEVRTASLDRNFYATSSCGICGKASLLALRSIAPARRPNTLLLSPECIVALPETMRAAQGTFRRTGGLHAAALFDVGGTLLRLREDVGRHNAVDKLVGASLLADELPLRDSVLLLSGRVSFELMQKAIMAGISCVVAIGAPSSLAVEVAQAFDVTLIGFLRDDHFNIYHGAARVAPA